MCIYIYIYIYIYVCICIFIYVGMCVHIPNKRLTLLSTLSSHLCGSRLPWVVSQTLLPRNGPCISTWLISVYVRVGFSKVSAWASLCRAFDAFLATVRHHKLGFPCSSIFERSGAR